MENHDAAQGPKSLSGRKHHPHGARLRSSYATGLSGQAPKPHSMSVETTFSTVSAITNHTAARANVLLGCGLPSSLNCSSNSNATASAMMATAKPMKARCNNGIRAVPSHSRDRQA